MRYNAKRHRRGKLVKTQAEKEVGGKKSLDMFLKNRGKKRAFLNISLHFV